MDELPKEPTTKKNVYLNLLKIFAVFLVVGMVIGYFIPQDLTVDETGYSTEDYATQSMGGMKSYDGVITYIGDYEYPQDNITYVLTDSQGNDIILLKANDQKLDIVQGLFVKVTGKMTKTLDGSEEVLQVTQVTLKHGSD